MQVIIAETLPLVFEIFDCHTLATTAARTTLLSALALIVGRTAVLGDGADGDGLVGRTPAWTRTDDGLD